LKKDAWTKVYASACADDRLSDGDLRVFIAIKLRIRGSGSCWECTEKIGKRAGGKGERAVQRSITNLKKYGYVDEIRDKSRKTGRRLVTPSSLELPPSDPTPRPVENDAPPRRKRRPK
jgi:hypothetical protein